MKVTFVFAAMFITYFSFGQAKADADIVNLSKKRIQWLIEGKADSLAKLYDERSITVHGNGMIKTAKEQLGDVSGGKITYKSIDVKETTVQDFGDVAVLVGKGLFKISLGGNDMAYNMVYTEVYQKKEKQWKLIARHASELPSK